MDDAIELGALLFISLAAFAMMAVPAYLVYRAVRYFCPDIWEDEK